MATIKVTEKQFAKFVKVQMSGRTNMCDVRMVKILTGLKEEVIRAIMKRYEKLDKQFPKVCQAFM